MRKSNSEHCAGRIQIKIEKTGVQNRQKQDRNNNQYESCCKRDILIRFVFKFFVFKTCQPISGQYNTQIFTTRTHLRRARTEKKNNT